MKSKKEVVWGIKVVDSGADRGRCTRQLARNARKNVKCHLSPEKIVRYIARIVSLSAKIAAVK